MPKQGGNRKRNESFLTRSVNSVFAFVRFAEFEILFVLFFLVAFIIFKDLGLLDYEMLMAMDCGTLMNF
ncbi:hypothetical protein CsSME_00027745 [Camellia sinensis var. sinensis]